MKAFFDIDTQIDFVYPAGALYGAGAERVLPAVAQLNRYAAGHGIRLFSTTCAHPENAKEFRVWPPHCVLDTVGQQKPASTLLASRVTVPNRPSNFGELNAEQILIEKDDLDLFTNPNTEMLLNRFSVDECFVYGVFTEYCVKSAIMGLLKRGRRVSLIFEATAHLAATDGDRVLSEFVAAGGQIVSATLFGA
jgi:nicotinamidase/pyrazinamidase